MIDELIKLDQVHALIFTDSNINEKQFLKLTRMRHLAAVSIHGTRIKPDTTSIFTDTYARIWHRACVINSN